MSHHFSRSQGLGRAFSGACPGKNVANETVLLAFPLLAVLAAAAPAAADCVSECQASTYCDSDMNASGECNARLNACYRSECGRPARLFGAIAWGATSMAYGYSYDLPDAASAGRRAMANCARHGNDCHVVSTFSNGCAALAADGEGRYSVIAGSGEKAVQADALGACARNGGRNCEVQVWSCAGP